MIRSTQHGKKMIQFLTKRNGQNKKVTTNIFNSSVRTHNLFQTSKKTFSSSTHQIFFKKRDSKHFLLKERHTPPLFQFREVKSHQFGNSGSNPSGQKSWSAEAALALLLLSATLATGGTVKALESEQRLSWTELVHLSEQVGLSGVANDHSPDHPERLEQECFNKLATLCRRREKSAIAGILPKYLARVRDSNGDSLLIAAVREGGSLAVVRHLDTSEKREGLRSCDNQGNSPLHIAAEEGRYDLINEFRLCIGKTNQKGETPLHIAIRLDRGKFIEELVAHGGDRHRAYTKGRVELPPLALAVRHSAPRSFAALSPSESEVKSAHIPTIGNLLHEAVRSGRPQMIGFLFKHYSRPVCSLLKKEDPYGRTPFALACANGDARIATTLHLKGRQVLQGAHLSYPSSKWKQWTPAHFAADQSQFYIVERLGEWGADLKADDVDHKTPRDLARSRPGPDAIDTVTAINNALGVNKRQLPFTRRRPQNIVFKGGGPKGAVYVGALKKMEEEGFDEEVTHVAGTSAGAITAIMYALGYTADQMKEEMCKKNFLDLLDPKNQTCQAALQAVLAGKNSNSGLSALSTLFSEGAPHLLTSPGSFYRELTEFDGLCKGADALAWIEELIEQGVKRATGKKIPHLTFGELRRLIAQGYSLKHIRVYAIPIDKDRRPVCFSSEDKRCDNLIISDAVRASMSIPFVFEPHTLYYKEDGERRPDGRGRFIDGGLIRNFPIDAFDSEDGTINKRTLGLTIQSDEKRNNPNAGLAKMGPLQFTSRVGSVWMDAEELLARKDDSRVVTISPKGVSLLDFDLPKSKVEELIQSGYDAICNSPLFAQKKKESSGRLNRLNFYRAVVAPLPHFVGREEERRDLVSSLRDRRLPYQKRVIVHLISGLPGMGKTELARKALDEALDPLDRSTHAFELDYKNLDASYAAIAQRLRLNADGATLEVMRNKVISALEQLDQPWFLIVNNVENEQRVNRSLFPERGGHLIITAHSSKAWSAPDSRIGLNILSLDDAVSLIEKITGEKRSQEMERLATRLGRYPLALDQAARYIRGSSPSNQPSHYTVKEYLTLLPKHSPPRAGEPNEQRYKETLQEVLAITFNYIKKEHPKSWEWLQLSSWFDSEDLPVSWLAQWMGKKDSSDYRVKEIIGTLRELGIVRKVIQEEEECYLSLHGLLQEMARPKDKKPYLQALEFVATNYSDLERIPGRPSRNIFHWMRHFDALIEHAPQLDLEDSAELMKVLHGRALLRLHLFGDSKGAISDLSRERKVKSSWTNVDPDELAEIDLHMGKAYISFGFPLIKTQYLPDSESYSKPILLLKSALELKEKKYGTDALELKRAMIWLSEAYDMNREFEKSLSLLKRLEKIIENKEPNCQLSRAEMANNLAATYSASEDHQSAIAEWKKSCLLFDELVKKGEIDPLHLDAILSHYNLGVAYLETQEYDSANEYLEPVLEKMRARYSTGHPHIFHCLAFNAKALTKLGKTDRAAADLAEGLKTLSKLSKCEGPNAVMDHLTEALIECLEAMDHPKRLPILEETLPICETTYGKSDQRVEKLKQLQEPPKWSCSIM